MSWREKFENNFTLFVLGLLLGGFVSGVTTAILVYEHLILPTHQQIATEREQLRNKIEALQGDNTVCIREKNEFQTKLAAEVNRSHACPDADELNRKLIELSRSNSGLKQDNDKLNATLRKCTSDVNRVNVDNETLRAINKKCSSEIIKPKALPTQQESKPRLDETSNNLLLYIYDNHNLTKVKIAQAFSMTMEQAQYYLDKLYEYKYISESLTRDFRPTSLNDDVVLTTNGRKYVVEQLGH